MPDGMRAERAVAETPAVATGEERLAAGREAPAGVGQRWGVLGTVERLLLVAGIALFAVLVRQVGLGEVVGDLRLIGWGFSFIIGQEVLAYLANTFGWRWAFGQPRPSIPFGRLLAARIAGDAVNNVTPTATVGGEFIRARMLGGGVSATRAWASVAAARIAQSVAQMFFIVVGLILVVGATPLPRHFQQGILIGLSLLATGIGTAVVLQRRGMFMLALRLVRKTGLRVSAGLEEKIRRLDAELVRFHKESNAFFISAGWFLAGWSVGVLEIYLIMLFLHLPVTWHLALTVEVLSETIDGVLFFVPLKAGTQEGGKWLIFTVLGLDPAKGLSLGIARRIRELSWAGIGLLLLSRHQIKNRRAGRSG